MPDAGMRFASLDGVMKFYSISNNAGYGSDPVLLGFAHTQFPACSHSSWFAEETTAAVIAEYEKYNGPAKWFTCEHCLAEFQQASLRPISCGNCGHDNN